MYGAILGDIIGSPFEFDRGDKTKDFELFTPGCEFTDDSVMTIAVPEAIIAFLESENFEDAIRNAVSLGGDADTLAAITGSIAEAFYEIPELLREECKARVTKDMLGILELFDEIIDRERMDSYDNEIEGNAGIETAIHQLYALEDKNSFLFFVTMMCARMRVGGQVLVSFVTFGDDMYCDLDVYNLKKGETVTLDHDVRMHMDTVTSETEDGEWFFFFTNHEELKRQESGNVVMSVPLKDILEISYHSNKVNGLVVNPFGRYVKLDKKLLKIILDEFNKNWKVEEQ